jgi:hypothetical protein
MCRISETAGPVGVIGEGKDSRLRIVFLAWESVGITSMAPPMYKLLLCRTEVAEVVT